MSKHWWHVMPYIMKGEFFLNRKLEGWYYFSQINLASWRPIFRFGTNISIVIYKLAKESFSDINI
jgi:hypothetical protein